MKKFNYFNRSLSGQVLSMMGVCFLFFIIGTGLLFYFQHRVQNEYIQKRETIEDKQQIIQFIYDQIQADTMVMADSVAIKVPENKEVTLNQETEMNHQMAELDKLLVTEEERSFYRMIDDFTTYYFTKIIPSTMNEYNIHLDPSVNLTDSHVASQVKGFLHQTDSFNKLLDEQLDENANRLNEKQEILQNSINIIIILFLILLLSSILMIFKKIGKPLADFTYSANEIAAGRDAVMQVDSNRKDELGTLSVAFQKMVKSIQDKEQDLIAHNEELVAQQDELQAQQQELQSTLEMLTEKEKKLIRRNELINGISSSLDKEKVLQSVVKSMCKVTRSDKGIITYLYEGIFSSYAVSSLGIEQFRRNLDSGFVHRLSTEKKAFTVKREQDPVEKGYHDTLHYSYDVYLPIISDLQVVAIMVFTRYGDPFSTSELDEYETLARQIAIYLEKIKLFEQSETDRHLNQDILNTVQEGIQLIDKDRKMIQVNKQLGEIFGGIRSVEELLGLSWDKWSIMMAEKVQENEFIDSLNHLIDSAFLNPDEEHSYIYRKNDSNQVIQVYCKSFKNGCNKDFGTLLVHRDITKEYEVAQMKSEFVSTVSHELRTPLASVLGFTELLLTKELKPERKEKYLQTIYKEAKRLTGLINDFLDIQRMESKKQTYEKKSIDLTSILKNVIELQEVNTSLHRINFLVELEETTILGDRNKIEQVFINLLSNAIKYSPNGGNIFIRIYGSHNMVCIDFKDEGLGIPEEAIPNLFQQFYRVDNSDRRRIGGTGLGLAIVQEIVKAHNGIILVSSEYGKSSTFTIQFPEVGMKSKQQSDVELDTMLRYTIMVI